MLSKKTDKTKDNGRLVDGPDTPVQLASDGMYFGILRTDKPLRIDGEFTGVAFCDNKVYLGKNSKFSGDLICRDAVIEGVVDGNVMCSNKLWLHQNGVIEGNARVTLFENQEGAQILNGVFIDPKLKQEDIKDIFEKRCANIDFKQIQADIFAAK